VSALEETIDAMLDSNGQLRLSHQSRLPHGPVRVTIRAAAALGTRRGLADVIREIAAEQRARGFPGRMRTPSATGNWAPRVARPRRGDREC
jgi:hypothetical protein